LAADARELAAVFAGGAIGATARAELALALPSSAGTWPWATLIVNVAGASLLGYLAVRLMPADLRWPLLATGFCGGLTTFSTFQLELLRMLDRGRAGLAVGYAAVSIAAGLCGVWLGHRAGREPA
jgi:CrcB protein